MSKLGSVMFALAVFACADAAAGQQVFKCVQNGKTTIQAEPCPVDAKQGEVKAPAGPPAAADVSRAIEFMSSYRACADVVTIWGEEMSGYYEQWRKRNAAMVSHIESDRNLSAQYAQKVKDKHGGKTSMCREVALELRGVK